LRGLRITWRARKGMTHFICIYVSHLNHYAHTELVYYIQVEAFNMDMEREEERDSPIIYMYDLS